MAFRVNLLCLLSVLVSALLVFAASVGWDRITGVSWAEWGTARGLLLEDGVRGESPLWGVGDGSQP